MRCPSCTSADTSVTDTRVTAEGVRRHRRCLACGLRFRSTELHDGSPRPRLVLGLVVSEPLPGRRGNRRLNRGGRAVEMRAREAEVLQVLSETWPRVVPLKTLERRVWGHRGTTDKTLRTTVHRLGLVLQRLDLTLAVASGAYTVVGK